MKEPILYRILRPLDKIFIKIYLPKMIGLENIKLNEGLILAGNHTSKMDPLLLMACTKRTIHYLGKIELFNGIKKYFTKNMGVIPVNRKRKNPEAIVEANKYLDEGKVIGIFPEGTINRTNDIIMPFKHGAVRMASDSSAWIIPFAISGKFRILKKGLIIRFGKPYKVSGSIEEETKKLEQKVIKLLKENENGRA